MSFLTERIIDLSVLSGIAAIFLFSVKRYLARQIDRHFERVSEAERQRFEMKKNQMLELLSKRNEIYPEILELVYRLRNGLRLIFQRMKQTIVAGKLHVVKREKLSEFSENVYLLTERLYKYKAHLDDDTFAKLHRFKRLLQDAIIMNDAATRAMQDLQGREEIWPSSLENAARRGVHGDFTERGERISIDTLSAFNVSVSKDAHDALVKRYEADIQRFGAIYEEIDKLYGDITFLVKRVIEGHGLDAFRDSSQRLPSQGSSLGSVLKSDKEV